MNERKPLLNSSILLAAATASLYCVSTAYYGGLLATLRLDANILDRNFHQVLYSGFLISFAPALLTLLAYAAARFFYSHMFLPGLNDWLRKSRSRKRHYLSLKNRWEGKRRDSPNEQHAKLRTSTVLFYVAISIAYILSMLYFEAQGRKAAQALIEMLEKPLEENELVSVKIDDQMHKLLCLACGVRNCAGIDPTTKVVYYFPQNGHSFQYLEPTPSKP